MKACECCGKQRKVYRTYVYGRYKKYCAECRKDIPQ